ncbi:hypothetical protein OAF27_02850, partial [Verrucomicrobiales bacterium]|nr:hypothetical protein [Verrucomicrobiales bacterium]
MSTEDDTPPIEPFIDPDLERRLTALILGEASEYERAELSRFLASDPDLRARHEQLTEIHTLLATSESKDSEPSDWKLPGERRKTVLATISSKRPIESDQKNASAKNPKNQTRWAWVGAAAAVVAIGLFVPGFRTFETKGVTTVANSMPESAAYEAEIERSSFGINQNTDPIVSRGRNDVFFRSRPGGQTSIPAGTERRRLLAAAPESENEWKWDYADAKTSPARRTRVTLPEPSRPTSIRGGTALEEVDISPNDDEIRRGLDLAEANESLGRYDEAKTQIGEALAKDPDNELALKAERNLKEVIAEHHADTKDYTRAPMMPGFIAANTAEQLLEVDAELEELQGETERELETKQQIKTAETHIAALPYKTGEQLLEAATALGLKENPIIVLKPRYDELKTQLQSELDSGLATDSPEVVKTRSEIQEVRENLERGVTSLRSALETRSSIARQSLTDINAKEVNDELLDDTSDHTRAPMMPGLITTDADDQLNELDAELKILQDETERARVVMLGIMVKNNIVDTSPETSRLFGGGNIARYEEQKVSSATKRELEAKQQLQMIETQIMALRDKTGEELINEAVALDLEDSTISLWKPEYDKLQVELQSALSSGYEENHPKVESLRDQLGEVTGNLENGVKSLRSVLDTQLKVASQTLQSIASLKDTS